MTAETAEKTTDDVTETDAAPAVPETEAPPKDLGVILPDPGDLTIAGVHCTVRRLRMREFFGLMGILTNGLGPAVGQMGFGSAMSSDEFGELFMAAFIMAVPNQIPQFIQYLQSIIEPQGSKQDERTVKAYLDNPELEDMLPILDVIITNEKDSVFELMGKARAYMSKWQGMFQR